MLRAHLPNVHTNQPCMYRNIIIILMVLNASICFVLAFFYIPGLDTVRRKKRVSKTWQASLNNYVSGVLCGHWSLGKGRTLSYKPMAIAKQFRKWYWFVIPPEQGGYFAQRKPKWYWTECVLTLPMLAKILNSFLTYFSFRKEVPRANAAAPPGDLRKKVWES